MIGNKTISLRRYIDADDLPNSAHLALFDECIEHRKFHFAIENAAAHQPKIHFDSVVVDAPDQHRDQAVVAKLVRQSAIEREKVAVVSDRFHFGARVPSCREIELVGFVDQLRDALDIDGQ